MPYETLLPVLLQFQVKGRGRIFCWWKSGPKVIKKKSFKKVSQCYFVLYETENKLNIIFLKKKMVRFGTPAKGNSRPSQEMP